MISVPFFIWVNYNLILVRSFANYTFNLYNFNCIYDFIILDYLYSDQHLSNDYIIIFNMIN